MSIFTVTDIINEIKKYAHHAIVSLLLTCKSGLFCLKECKKQIHDQALERELKHCTKGKKIKLHDRLCSYQYNYRVVQTNNNLYAIKVDIINYDYYTIIHNKNKGIQLEKYKNRPFDVNYGIILYPDGPIATSIHSPYLKYKTVPIGTTVKIPEVNMIVTVQSKRNYQLYEYYITYADHNSLLLHSLYTTGPTVLKFMKVSSNWICTDNYTIDKIGGFIVDLYRAVHIVNHQ